MGNHCCVNEGHVIEIYDATYYCESIEEIIEILNNDMNVLRKIEATIYLINNKKVDILKKEDKIFLEYQKYGEIELEEKLLCIKKNIRYLGEVIRILENDDNEMYDQNLGLFKAKIRDFRKCYYLFMDKDKITEKSYIAFFDARIKHMA